MADKGSFVLYSDCWPQIEKLTIEQRGILFTAIYAHACGHEKPEMDAAVDMAFSFIAAQIDRDNAKWEKIRLKRAEAGKRGGIASGESRKQEQANEANASLAKQNKQEQANEAVNVTVTVTGTVNDTVKDSLVADKSGNGKKAKKPLRVFADDSYEMQLSLLLAQEMRKNNPNCRLPESLHGWCDDFRLLLERDGRAYDDVSSMIRFCQYDDFWRGNILSPAKLRKQYDQLTLKREEARRRIEHKRNG